MLIHLNESIWLSGNTFINIVYCVDLGIISMISKQAHAQKCKVSEFMESTVLAVVMAVRGVPEAP